MTAIAILNLNGQSVKTLDAPIEVVDMSTLHDGVYFVKLTTANTSKTTKVIKE